jgi:hypothetical protein
MLVRYAYEGLGTGGWELSKETLVYCMIMKILIGLTLTRDLCWSPAPSP